MASFSKSSTTVLVFFLTIFSSLHHFSVSSFEFQVGGSQGWVVPPANDSKIYNDWASENRFLVGDSIRFKYKKDSVMEVNDTEYKRCNSSHPNLFSNTGNTVYKLDQPGPFYFISGVSGHCEKGQRMIVKVMSHEEDSPSGGGGKSSGSHVAVSSLGVSALVFVQFVLSFVASRVI
uniref:Phytocyanin domain-containing protein n=1 Tax=Fagus sylvatica TaxID=28930 RepID=A0A2N9F6P0_FAGSY